MVAINPCSAIAARFEGNRTADYRHSIVQRRKGTFANSKNWLRRSEGP